MISDRPHTLADTSQERYHAFEGTALDKHIQEDRPSVNQSGAVGGGQSKTRWTSIVPDASLPKDDYTGGRSYIDKWRMQPAPEEVQSVAERRAAADKENQASEPKDEDASEEGELKEEEMDELQFLERQLGMKR